MSSLEKALRALALVVCLTSSLSAQTWHVRSPSAGRFEPAGRAANVVLTEPTSQHGVAGASQFGRSFEQLETTRAAAPERSSWSVWLSPGTLLPLVFLAAWTMFCRRLMYVGHDRSADARRRLAMNADGQVDTFDDEASDEPVAIAADFDFPRRRGSVWTRKICEFGADVVYTLIVCVLWALSTARSAVSAAVTCYVRGRALRRANARVRKADRSGPSVRRNFVQSSAERLRSAATCLRRRRIASWRRSVAPVVHRVAVTASIMAIVASGIPVRAWAADFDWGVTDSGLPGVYTWQLPSNWKPAGQDLSSTTIPGAVGDVVHLNLLDLSGNQIINLDGLVTVGTLNIGDTSGGQSYTIAAGTGGSLVFDGGSASTLNKTGGGFDRVTANITLTAAAPLTIDLQDGGLVLTGIISGAGGFTKEGIGTLILRAVNTYTGVTTLNNGMTHIMTFNDNGAALGATGAGNQTIVNAGASLVINNDQSGGTTGGGASLNTELLTISGDGFRGLGALRNMLGRESSQFTGVIDLAAAARVQTDFSTLTLSGAIEIDNTLTIGGAGFTSLTGAISGAGDIRHYGVSGFRMQNTTTGQTYSGTISSSLGEVRGDVGNATASLNPYAEITALNLTNSWLRLTFGNAAGGAADVADSRFSTTAPISMAASQIYLDNASFSTTTTNFFDYAVAQTFGVTTMTGGHNRIGFRSADTGSVTLTFTDILRPNPGTTLEFHVDSLVGAALGTSAKHRIINSALEAGPTPVPLVIGAYTAAEFVKYQPAASGGFGYTALGAADYAVNTTEDTWASGQNIKVDNGNRTITADRIIQSLNIQGTTDRIVSGAAGTTLTVESGGIIMRDDGHTISVPFLTAGAASNYQLYDVGWSFGTIRSTIMDNGANPVSLIKTGTNTTRFLGNNTYTGTTYLNEGMFQDAIGARNWSALGTGNFVLAGGPNVQSAYDNDDNFMRALGAGAGEVQVVGGGGAGGGSTGFSAYGAPIDLNFGGAGATITWGSTFFNPGIFTLNGGNATHVLTWVNDVDLGGEQRYIRLDGNSSGGNRAVMATIAGDIFNGGIVKRGGGVLFIDAPKSYESATIIQEGEIWLRGAGMLGADVVGNDILIGPSTRLKIDAPSNIGSRQMIALQNSDDNNAAAIAFGSGYGDGSSITFSGLIANAGSAFQTGPNNILIANQQIGTDRRNRIAVQISGIHDFSTDLIGRIKAAAPDVEAYFGADTGNGTYTGATLTATGVDKATAGATFRAFRLGTGGGTLTIANSYVLNDNVPLVVGATDNTGRTNIGGIVYIPYEQSYTGTVSQTIGTVVTAGNLVGAGGILVVGQNAALNALDNTILLRTGEIRFGVDKFNAFSGQQDAQYAARNIDVRGGTGTMRVTALSGGQYANVTLNNLTIRMDNADRVFSVNSIGTTYMHTSFNGQITLENLATARNVFFDVGSDNSFQTGLGLVTLNGVVGQTGTAAVNLQKRNGGALILANENTYDGTTNVQQGRLVLAHTGAAGNTGSTINLNTTNDRRSDLEFRVDGVGPFLFDNTVATTGGNDGSTRVITVGSMNGSSTDQVVQIPTLTIGHAGTFSTNGTGNSAVFFDGYNGYRLEITGTLNLNRDIVLRTRGALVTVSGVVAGGAANDLEKSEQGTLWLSGDNTYGGNTTISNGYLVLAHDNALGAAVTDVTFRNNAFTQILASGARMIGRNFINTASASTQTLGGLDGGAKTFSGNINLSTRGMDLIAATGGDVTFTGTISGAFGINKVGPGTVVLNPTSGGNTFNTGGVRVTQGTLVGEAQAAGNPFGTDNPFTLQNGTLRLNNNTAAANATASAGALTIDAGNAALVLDGTGAGGNATTWTFGSLTRSNGATLTLKGVTTDLGGATNEIVAFTTAPSVVNGTIGTWAAVLAAGSGNAAHYAGVSGSNVVTAAYTASGVDLDTAAGATDLLDLTGIGGNLTGNRTVYAFRTDAGVALNSFTLNIGDPNSGTAGQAGMLLNNGADVVVGGGINFGTNRLTVYADDAATSTIGALLTNYRNNTNNTLTTVFTKFGPGTLELSNSNNSFQGHIQVNQGTLSLTAANVVPMFTNLNVMTGSTVTIMPGASVVLNDNNQEFGNLAGSSAVGAVRNTAGTLDLGTATLIIGRAGGNTVFSGQIIGGAGSKITKVGTGRVTIDNWDASAPNSLGTLDIAQGIVQTWLNDQSWATPGGFAVAVPASTSILLRGGEWEAYVVGDNTSNYQLISLGHSVVHQGGNSVLDTNRWQGATANKILKFDNLTLDKQLFLVTGGNAIYPRFDGTITLTNNARVQTDAPLLLAGVITGDYTFAKTGGSNWEIGGDNSAWNGGVVATDGTILFGNRYPERAEYYQGGTNHFFYSATANLGTGDIVINRNTSIRITAPTNILSAQGQRVQIFGALQGNLPRIDLGLDAPVVDYNLRSLGEGALNLGLNDGYYTSIIDQSKLGNGRWGVGAWTTTWYVAPTMGAGADNVFRFLGTNATFGITQTNALSGTAELWVGAPQYHNGFALANTSALVRLYGDQSYTGNTTIFRSDNTGNTNNFLSILGDSRSPVFDVFGRLEARGDGRFTRDDGSQFNVVNLYPGSHLRLDYSMDVNDNMLISRLDNSNLGLETDENKWGDSTPLVLDGATINLINSSGRQNQERVGAITVKNGAAVYLERNGTNGQIVLITSDVVRSGQATFAVRENANELGRVDLQGQKFFIDDGATMLDAQGLMPVWMINPSRNTFLTYSEDFGVQNAAFTASTTTAGGGAAFLAAQNSTSIADYGVGTGDATLAGTVDVWALRISHQASSNDTVLTGGQINIHSGGLIVDNRDNARVNFDTTALYFGDGATPVEGVIYSDQSSITTRIGGLVTAANLTHHGPGQLHLTNVANAITGNIQMNGGTLFADGAGTLGSASITIAGDWLQNNDGQQMAEIRLRTNNNAATVFNNAVILAENMPYARLFAERYTGTSTSATAVTIPSLTILGSNTLQGSSLIVNNSTSTNSANTHSIIVSGATTIDGTAPFGLHVQAQRLQLNGALSTPSGARLVKSGDGQLRVTVDNSAWSGDVTLNRGEIAAIANAGNQFGTGDYLLNFGQIRMQSNTTRSFFAAAGQDITVAGAVTFVTNRNGATAERNMTIGVNAGDNTLRTMNGAHVRFDADSFGDDTLLESNVIVNDSAVFYNDDMEVRLQGELQGSGRLTKTGIWYMYLNENTAGGNADWHGIIDIQRGSIVQQQINDSLGGTDSSVVIRAGTALGVHSTAAFGTGLGVVSVTRSTTHLPVLGVRTAANFDSVLDSYNTKLIGTGFGVVAIDNNQSRSTDPNMGLRFTGDWFLGSNNGNGNLTANSVASWSGDRYLLGGGGSTLILNPSTAGSDQLSGTAQLIIGSANNVFGYGAVILGANANNSFSGGTLVTRSRNMDGTYRGAALQVQGGAVGTGGTFRTTLGTGIVDVFGEVRFEGSSGTAVAAGGLTNANTWVFHPNSRIRFDNQTPFTGSGTTGGQGTGTIGGGGRWADAVGITLDGAVLDLVGDNTNHAANTEIIGDLTVSRGAEVVVRRNTGFGAELIAANLFRGTPTATLMLRHDANLLGDAGTVNVDRFIISSGAGALPGQVPVTNNMVDPWIVSRSQHEFLKYDATLGFQIITEGGAPANYVTSTGGTLNGAVLTANDGTEILNLTTATATLGANLDIHALRTDRSINVSADGQFRNIIIRSGGLIQVNNQPIINADLYFGAAGDGTGQALIWANDDTLQINGKIYASEVVKAGVTLLNINSDQSQFTGNWNVNAGGGIQFLTPGAPSTGEVILNGSHMADNDNTTNLAEVRYSFNSGTPDLFTWNGGKITAYDINRVYVPTASDRLQQIPAIDLRTTNLVAGTGQEGTLFFQVDGFRSLVRTGTVTLYDHYLIHVESGSFSTGSTTGVQFGAGDGTGGLNNQGLFDLRKVGDGVLTLGDNSASFTGGRSITVGEGSVRVTHDAAFGGAGNNVHVTSTGTLEIAVAGFTPASNLTMDPGSAERWAVDGARSGNFQLAEGVSLQIMHSQTGTQTVELNGGSIMGYLPRDWEQVAVIHTLGAGISVNLLADSYLGQPYATSNNSLWDLSAIYDQGKINTSTGSNPSDPALRGSYLQIDGEITGMFGLTKVGQDVILLNGLNSYQGFTRIEGGILQIGQANALPTGTSLIMASTSGIFDLNGFDQEIASLSGFGGGINNGAFYDNVLTISQATDTTYGGTIDGNITLRKWGVGTLTLAPVSAAGDAAVGNGYRGGTTISEGKLAVGMDAALGDVPQLVDADNLVFNGGTLLTNAGFTLHALRGVTLTGDGTIEVAPAQTTQIAGVVTGFGALAKTGDGILQLNNPENNYTGATNIVAGTLQAAFADALAPTSRHVVTGDAVSGTLRLFGSLGQTIGSLASAGAVPGNAAVVFENAEVLTVGGDSTQDAVYAGAVNGAGVFRVRGGGALQTLAVADNSAQAWSTEIADGILNLAAGARLGSGAVTLGIAGLTGADDFTALHLQDTPVFSNNVTVANVNGVGGASITASGSDAAMTGTVTLNRNVYAGAAVGTRLSWENTVGGDGTITVIDGGVLRLTAANSYGAGVAGTSATPLAGGTVVRAGTVLLESSTAAGSNAISLGDVASTIGADVDRATFSSILGSGTWNPNGDGFTATSGGQDAAGTTGLGAFIGVNTVVDGFDYSSLGNPVGTRILVAGEEANPERNGIYVITAVNFGPTTTMNLVRADDFETSPQMKYGGQVTVAAGTYTGQTMWMFEEQVVVANQTTNEPIRFRRDVVNPDVAVMLNVAGLDVANNINVNALNGTGNTTVGGSADLTAGTGTFSGNLTLQDLVAGTAETKTVRLTSSTDAGITFSGALSEADPTAGTGDVLSIEKIAAGKATLSGTNTYRGTTTISAGTLQFARQVSLYNGDALSWTDTNLTVAAGATAAFNVGGAGEFTTADLDTVKSLGTATGGFLNGSTLGIDTTNAPSVVTYNSVIANTNGGANAIGLAKLGTGTLNLTAANTYAGVTNVAAGVLTVDGSIGTSPGNLAGDVTVAAGAVLNGNGSFNLVGGSQVVVNADAVYSAGADAANNASFSSHGVGNASLTAADWTDSAKLVFDFSTANSGNSAPLSATDWDFLSIGGTLNLTTGGTLDLYVNSWDFSGTPEYGQAAGFNALNSTTAGTSEGGRDYSYRWLWVDAASITVNGIVAGNSDLDLFNVVGDQSDAAFGSGVFHPAGGNYLTGGSFWVSTNGNDLFLNYNYAAVPEPGSLLLIGVAGLGVAAYRRRKRRRDEAATIEAPAAQHASVG